ncbi:hypothetical protein DEV91_111143 [Phyllobacterium brassicacearum]|uniref:hypothetical protein n=1 Tax=Phyllobacterium brassicacearum TaxID=314235 RepID=UPI0010DB983C|nr:hypothetical protein [Phyllobacterium brassicacearum]TDQ28088.1 hypothetical protein DEV91_111143 [Phyllobacterium brassicacearum]
MRLNAPVAATVASVRRLVRGLVKIGGCSNEVSIDGPIPLNDPGCNRFNDPEMRSR